MILIVFMVTLDISETYSRFDEYLAIEADDEFYSLLVCNIIRVFVICLLRRQLSNKP